MLPIFRIAAVLIFIGSTVFAQDLVKGIAAHDAHDYGSALQEFRPLAEQGNALAQFALGTMYAHGKGVLPDSAEAGRWYRLAAKQGHAPAQFYLGLKYFVGKGVPKDRVSAYTWLDISIENGDGDAPFYRDNIEKHMTHEQIVEATRRAKVCMSSDYQDCY